MKTQFSIYSVYWHLSYWEEQDAVKMMKLMKVQLLSLFCLIPMMFVHVWMTLYS